MRARYEAEKKKQINKWKWNKNIQYFYRYFIKFSVFVDNGKATPSTTDARCIKIFGLGWEWYVKKNMKFIFTLLIKTKVKVGNPWEFFFS